MTATLLACGLPYTALEQLEIAERVASPTPPPIPTDVVPPPTNTAVPTQPTWTPSPTAEPTLTYTPTLTWTPSATATERPSDYVLQPRPAVFKSITRSSPSGGTIIEKSSVVYYPVTGGTAAEIYQDILDNGPDSDDGHAVAQVQYGIQIQYEVNFNSTGFCAPVDATTTLTLDYTYPEYYPSPEAPVYLLEQWEIFFKDVVRHEETHGEIARSCVDDLMESFFGLLPQPTCESLRSQMNNIVSANGSSCAALQDAFDESEGPASFP